MADNKKQGFWSYLGDQVKQGFQSVRDTGEWLVKGVSNKLAGHEWSEDNQTLGDIITGTTQSQPTQADSISVNKPTLNDVANGTSTLAAQPDISTPQNLLGTNTSGGQTDINMDDSLDKVVQANPLSASSILQNTGIKESEKTMKAEEEAKNEGRWTTVGNWFKSVGDSISDWNVSNILDTKRQSEEKTVALGYNEDNGNILSLTFNEGQGLTDDFRDTALKRGQGNKQIFDILYEEYGAARDSIMASNEDDATKIQMLQEAYDNFLNEVNDRKLLKVYEDDFYSDGLIYGLHDKNAKWIGRRKDQFTEEQLARLAKSDIKEAGTYPITADQLDAFLDAYGYNDKLAQRYSLTDETDTEKVRYELEDEGLATLKSTEIHQIIDPAMDQLKALEVDGLISGDTRNEILRNSYTVAENALNQMHLYLDGPLAYYKAVQSKDYSTLTTGEKAILSYGDGIMQFMDDYTKALQKWLSTTISTGIENGELVGAAEMVDGMSITDFFKDAISDANIKAGGLDLLATESAIDAMQHINNNINYLYWQGKGNWLRRGWTEAQRIGGAYGYGAGELYQLGIMGWVKGIEALQGKDIQSLADYDLADFTTGRLVGTEYEVPRALRWISDNEDFAKLLTRYGLAALENIPEFAGEFEALRPFLGGNTKYAKAGSKILELEKMTKATRKLSLLEKVFGKAKSAVGTTASAGGTKNWVGKMYNAAADSLNPNIRAVIQLGVDGIKRVAKDQAIDAIASYYDTESYSTPSFILSTGLTALTELLPAVLKDTQLFKMIKNKMKGLDLTQGTGWRLMNVISSDEDLLKRWSQIYGTDFNTFKLIAGSEGWNEVEDLMKVAYNELSPDGKMAINNFSKQQLLEQLKRVNTIDWQSTYGKNLMSLINAKGSNISDVWKYILGATGNVELGGFASSVLFKEGADKQTRYLKQAYNVELDRITGQFRRGLENGFTREQIEELASKTSYNDVIKDGQVNPKYFEKDGDKYILNSDGANYLKLQVTEYTDAMRKADIIRAQSEGTKEFLDETFAKIASAKGISPDVAESMAKSGAYQKMLDEFSKVVC